MGSAPLCFDHRVDVTAPEMRFTFVLPEEAQPFYRCVRRLPRIQLAGRGCARSKREGRPIIEMGMLHGAGEQWKLTGMTTLLIVECSRRL